MQKILTKTATLDAVVTTFLKDQSGVKKEYTALNRDDITAQLPGLKKRFLTYKDFANADVNALFTDELLNKASKLTVNNFMSCFIKNKGQGRFERKSFATDGSTVTCFRNGSGRFYR